MVLLLLGFLAINVIGLRTRLNLLQKRVSQVHLLNLRIKCNIDHEQFKCSCYNNA